MAQRSIPAPFLTKTYELVDDSSTDDVVSWGENGITFVVWKTAEFAKDLLPKYFKHNNFSSFVRQLNTYGFRKIVPDKWEFANDNFKKGQRELLTEIRRRKAAPTATVAGKPNPVQSTSGDDAGSTSTLSPESKNGGSSSVEIADLSGENEKLRRDNEMLSSELAQTKKKCQELVGFLTRNLNVGPDQINRILKEEIGIEEKSVCGALGNNGVGGDEEFGEDVDDDDDDDNDEKEESRKWRREKVEEEGLKLFGVWLKDGNKRGRCWDESDKGLCGAQHGGKVMKTR